MLSKWGLFYVALLFGAALAFLAITPPSPQNTDTPLDQFSSARAMTDVRIIASEPHPTGTEANAKVRAYLTGRLTELGLEVSESESFIDGKPLARLNKWKGETKSEQAIYNVIGVRPGMDRTIPALLLMAHHDTVWGSPGAADDTVGIASILEIIRALNETETQASALQRDLIVLFTDAEEVGLSGAVNFFSEHPLRDKIGAVINFEARGGGGTANLFQTSTQNGNAARVYARAVKKPSASSLSTYIYNVLPNDTDLTPALKKDYVAFNIANIGGAEYYHSPKIEADALSEATLQHMGSQGLDLTRALLSADDLPSRKADAIFFDLFGLLTIIYAPFWGWVFLGFAALFYAASVKSNISPKEIVSGAMRMVGFLGVGGGLLFGLNLLSGGGASSNYYDRLAAIPKLEALAFFLCVSLFFAIFGHKKFSVHERLGAALPLFVIGVMGQVFAPTATYFIALALFLCAFMSLVITRWPKARPVTWGVTFISALIIGYMLSLGHLLMLGVGPDIPSVAILPAAIFALAVLPHYQDLANRPRNFLTIISLILAFTMTFWIRLDPVAATIPLY